MSMQERMDPEDRPFVLATDVGWTTAKLQALREALEVLAPIGSDDVRLVEAAREDESTLLVGLGSHLGDLLDLVDGELGDRFVGPLEEALAGHRSLPGVAMHRVTLTGLLERDVEVALIADSEDPDDVIQAVASWPDATAPIGALLERNRPENVRTVEMVWTPAVEAWTLHELWLVNGEVIPGPIIEADPSA